MCYCVRNAFPARTAKNYKHLPLLSLHNNVYYNTFVMQNIKLMISQIKIISQSNELGNRLQKRKMQIYALEMENNGVS